MLTTKAIERINVPLADYHHLHLVGAHMIADVWFEFGSYDIAGLVDLNDNTLSNPIIGFFIS